MKTKLILLVTMIAILSLNAFAQVKVTSSKVTYKRTIENVSEWKKTFEVNYPKFENVSDDMTRESLESTFSYWRVYGTSLRAETGNSWLDSLNYKVKYNKNGILELEFTKSGSGASLGDYVETVVADVESGRPILFNEAFRNKIGLLQEIDKKQAIEMAAATKKYKADRGEGELFPEYVVKASDQVENFSISTRGVTFLYDYGFPRINLALQPEGRYFFSWAEIKPFLAPYGKITALSKKPIPKTVAIVDLELGGVLGGFEEGKFINAIDASESIIGKQKFARLLPGATNLKMNASQYKSVVSIDVDPNQPDEICPDYRSVTTGSERMKGIGIGPNATWNPVPRAVTTLSLTNGIYKNAVLKILRANKLTSSPVKLSQLYKVDLDGDGVDEVVISATHYTRGKNEFVVDKGGYSFVAVRKIVNGKPKDILLGADFITQDEQSAENTFKISSIADLNGDGKMEIVVFSSYYEGASSSAFEISGGVAKAVLETGCGL